MAKEHKQAVIAQKAIFTTGSMRLSRVIPSILFAILILAADVSLNPVSYTHLRAHET